MAFETRGNEQTVIRVRIAMTSGETEKKHKGDAGVLEIHVLMWMMIIRVYIGRQIYHLYIKFLYLTVDVSS